MPPSFFAASARNSTEFPPSIMCRMGVTVVAVRLHVIWRLTYGFHARRAATGSFRRQGKGQAAHPQRLSGDRNPHHRLDLLPHFVSISRREQTNLVPLDHLAA